MKSRKAKNIRPRRLSRSVLEEALVNLTGRVGRQISLAECIAKVAVPTGDTTVAAVPMLTTIQLALEGLLREMREIHSLAEPGARAGAIMTISRARPSRRALVSMAAASVASAAVASPSIAAGLATSADDPIFAAIEKHRRAYAAVCAMDLDADWHAAWPESKPRRWHSPPLNQPRLPAQWPS